MERVGDESASSDFFSCGPTGMPGKICQIFEAVMNTHKRGFYEKYIKLPQDTVLALLALAVLSPVLGLVALAVRLHLGAPVLFRQERAGKDGRSFTLYKFRTMSDRRDAAGALLPDEQRLDGFGRFLRSTSLDELPSLWNVVSGSCVVCEICAAVQPPAGPAAAGASGAYGLGSGQRTQRHQLGGKIFL